MPSLDARVGTSQGRQAADDLDSPRYP